MDGWKFGKKKSVWSTLGDLNALLYVTRNVWSVIGVNSSAALGENCASYLSCLS